MPDRTPIPRNLETEQQVLDALQKEIDSSSLTATAAKYELKPSQISDVLAGRAGLSKRMTERMRLKLHKLYERLAAK
jgi:hypothetical protein